METEVERLKIEHSEALQAMKSNFLKEKVNHEQDADQKIKQVEFSWDICRYEIRRSVIPVLLRSNERAIYGSKWSIFIVQYILETFKYGTITRSLPTDFCV